MGPFSARVGNGDCVDSRMVSGGALDPGNPSSVSRVHNFTISDLCFLAGRQYQSCAAGISRRATAHQHDVGILGHDVWVDLVCTHAAQYFLRATQGDDWMLTSDDYKPCIALSRTHERKASTLRYDTVADAVEKIKADRMAWVKPEDVETVKAALASQKHA